MKRTRGRVVHVESLEDLDRRLAAGATRLSGWRVRGLDLSDHGDILIDRRPAGATFLGCRFAPGDADRLDAAGALVLPALGAVPVDPYRSSLYTADELYDATPYQASSTPAPTRGRRLPVAARTTLARTLHDHAVDQALAAWVATRQLVGVMGGHAAQRGEASYAEAARLGHGLGDTHVVATGGGPGAMEAANLGARLAATPQAELETALALLARAPSFRPSVDAWLAPARSVLERYPDAADSLSIPTWHYGHEPSNVFATAIAKYLRNATREATLLEVCAAGIVFLPGAGGTVQEVFQDACENYYADESSLAPMVLVGARYWTETLPVWRLLQTLARGRAMEPHVHLVDSVEEAIEVVSGA